MRRASRKARGQEVQELGTSPQSPRRQFNEIMNVTASHHQRHIVGALDFVLFLLQERGESKAGAGGGGWGASEGT